MLEFCLAVLLLLATPGPGVLSTAGVGAAFGFNAGLRYVGGLFIGTNLVALIVVSGLAAIILANPWARTALRGFATVYLLYRAVRIAFAGRRIAFITTSAKPGLRAGLLLQLINPKAYAVNLTWFSGFLLLPESLPLETLLKFLIINLVWIPIHLLWLLAGSSVNELDLSPRSHFIINAGMATAMLAVVALAITSLLESGIP
jgi:threonine/homoserine/homoserine lactone efflux protein